MKKQKLSICILLFTLFVNSQNVYSQTVNTSNESVPLTLEIMKEKIFKTKAKHLSGKEPTIVNEMSRLKDNYKAGNIEKIQGLQNELNGFTE